MDYTEIFTKDVARRIYNDLMENNSGQLPFSDFKLIYFLNKKGKDNRPLEVEMKIVDEREDKKASYSLKYEDGFSNFRVIKGSQIVKR